MAGYVIVNISVIDPEKFKAYQAAVSPNIKAFGGRYLVRGGEVETVEGTHDDRRVVVLEFPSVEAAKGWWKSPEYREIAKLREGNATMDAMVVEGYDGG